MGSRRLMDTCPSTGAPQLVARRLGKKSGLTTTFHGEGIENDDGSAGKQAPGGPSWWLDHLVTAGQSTACFANNVNFGRTRDDDTVQDQTLKPQDTEDNADCQEYCSPHRVHR